MKKQIFAEDKGFQSEIVSKDARDMNIQVSNMNLTVLDATSENMADFVLPDSVETGAPSNIFIPDEIAPGADSCCAGLSVVSKMRRYSPIISLLPIRMEPSFFPQTSNIF